MDTHLENRAEALWKVAYAKAKRPLTEIRLPDADASSLAAAAIRAYVAEDLPDSSLAAASQWVDREVRGMALALVAERRMQTEDPNQYASVDFENPRLDLLRLKEPGGQSEEWRKFYDQLRPIAFGLAKRWQKPLHLFPPGSQLIRLFR